MRILFSESDKTLKVADAKVVFYDNICNWLVIEESKSYKWYCEMPEVVAKTCLIKVLEKGYMDLRDYTFCKFEE